MSDQQAPAATTSAEITPADLVAFKLREILDSTEGIYYRLRAEAETALDALQKPTVKVEQVIGEGVLTETLPTGLYTKEVVCDSHPRGGLRTFLTQHGVEVRCRKCLTVVLRIEKKAQVN